MTAILDLFGEFPASPKLRRWSLPDSIVISAAILALLGSVRTNSTGEVFKIAAIYARWRHCKHAPTLR